MDFNIKEGLRHTSSKTVGVSDTALQYGSGGLEVLATPAMIALMENAAMLAVAQHLPDSLSTVGIEINVEHVKASLVGATIEATATLTKIEGKRLYFLLKANDEQGEIGKGMHVRYIVDKKKFIEKLK